MVVQPATTLDAFLGGRLMLLQPATGYRAGLDAVLLAATVPGGEARGSLRIADLGAGIGTVGLCVAARLLSSRLTLIEREGALVALARQNIARNELDARVCVVSADIEAPAAALDALGLTADTFDHVVANPPFQVVGEGRLPADPLRARARVMAAGGVERWVRACARLVRPGGTAAMIHRGDALPELLGAFSGRFGALAVLPVHPRSSEPAARVIVTGTKGSGGGVCLLPGLVVHDAAGHEFTAMLQAILRGGAGLELTGAGAPRLVAAGAVA
jgi:tRNA1(Val) A37 N6-methylase TrmN6